eukprot:13544880-Heterocapsa_arctica.AAC.1
MSSCFNDTMIVFAPKGEELEDALGVVRAPQDTRPLGLKNSDVKAISGAAHSSVKHDLHKCASLPQNGFIAGR